MNVSCEEARTAERAFRSSGVSCACTSFNASVRFFGRRTAQNQRIHLHRYVRAPSLAHFGCQCAHRRIHHQSLLVVVDEERAREQRVELDGLVSRTRLNLTRLRDALVTPSLSREPRLVRRISADLLMPLRLRLSCFARSVVGSGDSVPMTLSMHARVSAQDSALHWAAYKGNQQTVRRRCRMRPSFASNLLLFLPRLRVVAAHTRLCGASPPAHSLESRIRPRDAKWPRNRGTPLQPAVTDTAPTAPVAVGVSHRKAD
eukprot:1584238-Pleurochrysis_carterae.AAC.2